MQCQSIILTAEEGVGWASDMAKCIKSDMIKLFHIAASSSFSLVDELEMERVNGKRDPPLLVDGEFETHTNRTADV